jgi:hypothetical protein
MKNLKQNLANKDKFEDAEEVNERKWGGFSWEQDFHRHYLMIKCDKLIFNS